MPDARESISKEEFQNLPLGEIVSYRGKAGVIYQKHGDGIWMELGFLRSNFDNSGRRIGYDLFSPREWEPSGGLLADSDFITYDWDSSIRYTAHVPCTPEIRAALGFLANGI